MTTLHNLLIEAKRIIATRETWTQHTNARTASDLPTNYHNPRACKFCVIGALGKAQLNLDYRRSEILNGEALKLLNSTANELTGCGSLPDVNDRQGFVAVHAVLDAAIKTLNRQPESK